MFKSYNGLRPYVFLSYSHKDSDRIFPLMEMLQNAGCNIWYDDGIFPSDEWADTVAKKLSSARIMLLVLSENSVNSQNVRREIYYAVTKNIDILPFYIDDVVLPDGLQLQLGIFQAVRSKNSLGIDMQVLKKGFPSDVITGFEPKLLYKCNVYDYYFVKDSVNCFSIIQRDNETGEIKTIFKNEQPKHAEIESVFDCYALRYAHNNDFYPFDGGAILFNVFCDHVSDRYVARFYVDYHFAIINPGTINSTFKVLKCRVKNYSKSQTEIAEYDENNIPSTWANQA